VNQRTDASRQRLFVLRVLVFSLLLTLFGRLWYMQVLAGDSYAQAAADNRTREVVTPAARGQILDDYGRPLVTNRTSLVVSVDRIKLERQPDGGKTVLHRLAQVLGVSDQDLQDRIRLCSAKVPKPCWNGSPYQPIPVTEDVDIRQALQILERQEEFPGVSADVQSVRDYPLPDGALASHVIGYLGPISDQELAKLSQAQQDLRRNTLVGRAGLEQSYDTYLRGRPGVKTVAVDHLGAVTGVVADHPPQAGDTLVTSIDAAVQHLLETSLAQGVQQARTRSDNTGAPYKADSAAGVILDAQTGHIVAMASYPTYQPQIWAGGRISEADYKGLTNPATGYPLLDRATLGQYAPGSTFKLISTAGLVQDGIANLNSSYECSSSYTIGGRTFHNFEGETFGAINLHTTIVKSCDTVYYRLAYQDWLRDQALVKAGKPPVEGVQKMAREFGLGEPTGVDLPAEATGLIEDRKTKQKQWEEFYRPNACKGANNPAFDAERRAFDLDVCKYGNIYNPGDQANFDIGQGTVLATPLQMAVAYAALVNGGKVYEPRIGKALLSPAGKVVKQLDAPVRRTLDVPPGVLDYIRAAMEDVPKVGTGESAFQGFPFDRITVGGKTGTAEVNGKQDTAWFASFAGLPGQPARYVAVVMVTQGGQGGLTSAPIVRHLWDGIFGLAPGSTAAMPGGLPPAQLPAIRPDGTVAPPARPSR
jgi:penicillin-binding protein 2